MLQSRSDVLLPWFKRHDLPDPAAVSRATFLDAVWTHWKRDASGRIGAARAMSTASLLVEVLRPACEKIEIVGELRRNAARVDSIEIVAVPIPDLHLHAGTPHRLRKQLDRGYRGRWLRQTDGEGNARKTLEIQSVAYWPGARRERLQPLHDWIRVELHLIASADRFGLAQIEHTGPAEFWGWLSRAQAEGGALPAGVAVDEGALWREADGRRQLLPTPTERDVFELIGLAYQPPADRRPVHN